MALIMWFIIKLSLPLMPLIMCISYINVVALGAEHIILSQGYSSGVHPPSCCCQPVALLQLGADLEHCGVFPAWTVQPRPPTGIVPVPAALMQPFPGPFLWRHRKTFTRPTPKAQLGPDAGGCCLQALTDLWEPSRSTFALGTQVATPQIQSPRQSPSPGSASLVQRLSAGSQPSQAEGLGDRNSDTGASLCV